jgi:hypothetical protein
MAILGNGTISRVRGASLQRSLRIFTPHLFEIENMAARANHTVASMINLVLMAGIEAIRADLPEDVCDDLRHSTPEQTKRLFDKHPGMKALLEMSRIDDRPRDGVKPKAKATQTQNKKR